MITVPGGWNDQGGRGADSAATALQHAEDTAPISAQRCLPVTGGRSLATAQRSAARTQLGMPALVLPPDEPPRSAVVSTPAATLTGTAARPPARRGPPPLPARFATPKVVVAATPLLPDTLPAQRLQLGDVTSEADADPLPLSLRRSTAPARVAHKSAAPTRMLRSSAAPAAAPGGLRGLLTAVLLKLLALLAPSQPLPEPSSRRQRR